MPMAVLCQMTTLLRRDPGFWILMLMWAGACFLVRPDLGLNSTHEALHSAVSYDVVFMAWVLGGVSCLLGLRAMIRQHPRQLQHLGLATEFGVFLGTTAPFVAAPLVLFLIRGEPFSADAALRAGSAMLGVFGVWALCLRLAVPPRVAVFVFLAVVALTRILPEPRDWSSWDDPLPAWILPIVGFALARWLWTDARTNTR